MTVDEAADRLRHMLVDAGFDSVRPDPAAAWEVFKRFVAESVDAQTTELWFEAADGEPTTESPAYFDFVRMFMHYPDDSAGWGEQITASFTAPPTTRLGLRPGSIQTKDVIDTASWFKAVETSPSFQIGVRFREWVFEVRIDSC